jgi:type VI protein secretion system component VasK
MEVVLELFGTVLVILGIGAGVWAIATGHIYGTFKAATENPLFALAAIAGIIFVVAGLILGNISLSGAIRNFEDGAGWVLTIGGILLVMALVIGITQDRIKTARKARASAQPDSQPAAGQPDQP